MRSICQYIKSERRRQLPGAGVMDGRAKSATAALKVSYDSPVCWAAGLRLACSEDDDPRAHQSPPHCEQLHCGLKGRPTLPPPPAPKQRKKPVQNRRIGGKSKPQSCRCFPSWTITNSSGR